MPSPLSRRDFLRSTTLGLAAAGLGSHVLSPASALAAPTPKDTSETLAAQLYSSLTGPQREGLCFAFDHPLRQKVDNNWMITKKSIKDALNPDQQDLVRQIFRHLHPRDAANAREPRVAQVPLAHHRQFLADQAAQSFRPS